MRRLLRLILLFLAMFVGCTISTPARIGMTKGELLEAKGYPTRVHRSVGSWGVREQWVYRVWRHRVYYYLDNGVVSGWSD